MGLSSIPACMESQGKITPTLLLLNHLTSRSVDA